MASATVKAWKCKGTYPDGLHQSTIPTPSDKARENSESKSNIIITPYATAINPVDIQAMNVRSWGTYLSGSSPAVLTGRDFSGIVLNGGSTGFKSGDEVMGLTYVGGALAEQASFPAAVTCMVKKPSSWSFEQAASIPLVWLTARTCIEEVASFLEKSPTKHVVVLGGSSATGIYTIKIAKKRGWTVLATSSARNKDFVLSELEADKHVDYTAENVRKAVSAFKPDVIIDCVGGTNCIGVPGNKRYISIVGDKVSRSTMGGPYTYYDYTHPVVMVTQWSRWLRGQAGLGESYDVVHLELRSEWLEEAATTLKSSDIYIDSTYEFDDARKAFEKLDSGRARGKVVIKTKL